MKNTTAKSVKMDETDYYDIVNGKCGGFPHEELNKVLLECGIRQMPFYLTNERGEIVKRII